VKKPAPRTTDHGPRIENTDRRGSWSVERGPGAYPIRWISETTSTNSAVLEIAKLENLKTLVLATDHQTEGRGQFGRKWLSKPGENLLFSIYFEPAIKPSEASTLTQIACSAVLEVLKHYEINCEIKKPNDILVNGKKICGILTESSSKGEKLEYVVVGIGLNINSSEETLIPEATSMKLIKQKVYDRTEILNRILTELQKQTLLGSGLQEKSPGTQS
jgi:BirA family biotin operon repressor/biotin-[acetyl-CoA-carboxylase] ligase